MCARSSVKPCSAMASSSWRPSSVSGPGSLVPPQKRVHVAEQRLAEVDHTVTKMKAGLQDYLAASEHAARDARWKAALSEIGLRATEALQMHGVTGWDQPYDGTGDALLGVKDIADSTLAEPSGKGRG